MSPTVTSLRLSPPQLVFYAHSHRDLLARLRNAAFHRSGKLAGARGHMLRVLSGAQQGWLGQHVLRDDFGRAWSAQG